MRTLIIIFISLICMLACNKGENGQPVRNFEILSTSNSECLSNSANKSENVESFIVSYIDEYNYKIEHKNATFNCCLPEGIQIDIRQSNDTIYFYDREKVNGNCKCICTYNTLIEFGEISNGSYVLCLQSGDLKLGVIHLDFNEKLYEEFNVSELEDNL